MRGSRVNYVETLSVWRSSSYSHASSLTEGMIHVRTQWYKTIHVRTQWCGTIHVRTQRETQIHLSPLLVGG
jgi:hypothetical protein